MEEIKSIMIKRLIGKGIKINNIPAYIRDLANIFTDHSTLSLQDLDLKLRLLGWDDFELDDHTLQLIVAFFEANDSFQLEEDMSTIFKNSFNQDNNPYEFKE